jgi:hypothetical protein
MSIVRRAELAQMTQPALAALYRRLGYIGGMHPPETWHKDEIIESILTMEMERRGEAPGCARCTSPGLWCGEGGVIPERRPCVCCGEPTMVRSLCGAARTAECDGQPVVTRLAPVTPQQAPRQARRAPQSRAAGRKADQEAATAGVIAGLATHEPIRFLSHLEGPFNPRRTGPDGRTSRMYLRPPLPGIIWAARIVTGYRWSRPYKGLIAVLDRSGAWVSAASSVTVAHGALAHTGAMDECDGRPGYYLVDVYEWPEADQLPSPLGGAKPGTQVWVPHPTATLLRDLVRQGRWPDVAVLDSYTSDAPVRLSEWTTHVNAVRAAAITDYGRQSPQYAAVKEAFGQAMSTMLGTFDGPVRRVWRSESARPDITHATQAQASATLWRWADDARRMVPELPPIALRNVDELVVPADALEILTSRPRPGGRTPMAVDELGIKLGSFKVKSMVEWDA